MGKHNIENRRYTGSKAKLVDWILDVIKSECAGNSFADIFAGTGIVAANAAKHFDEIVINDFLYSNFASYKAFFEKGRWDKIKLKNIVSKYNKLNSKEISDNYFSESYGGKYFSVNVSKIIGHIREDIEDRKKELSEKEYYILLVSLMYSIDRISNTVGHYDAYLQREPKKKDFVMELISTNEIKNVKIFREDANKLVKRISPDIVYIDPPYNSRQYSRFYHVLDNLVKWDKPDLFGVARKPEPENMSEYCKSNAPNVFGELINNLNCKYIVVSYNNNYNGKSNSSTNKIRLAEIENILESRGRTKIFSRKHKYFNSGKTNFSNHKEILFVTEVKNSG